MLGWIAATVGGVIKDIQVAGEVIFNYTVSEINSIPNAFNAGYETGLITGDDITENTIDHHLDIDDEIAPKKFGNK